VGFVENSSTKTALAPAVLALPCAPNAFIEKKLECGTTGGKIEITPPHPTPLVGRRAAKNT